VASRPVFEARMTQAEALMWRLDADPTLSGTFGNVMILDRMPDMSALERRLGQAAVVIPRLRQRVVSASAPWALPEWVDDPEFELGFHLRRVRLARPGGRRLLFELATRVVADPFERTRPLWQIVVVEPWRGTTAAVIEKLHHSVGDGEAGVAFATEFLDLERHPAPRPEPEPWHPRHAAIEGLDQPTGPLATAAGLLVGSEPGGPSPTGSAVMAAVTQLADLGRALSPLWTQRSLRRHLEGIQVPLDDLREAARALGSTLHSAVLCAAAEAAGAYHRQYQVPVDALRAAMPVSTRGDSSPTNAFSLARVEVPTGPMDLVDRLSMITAAARQARQVSRATPVEALASLSGLLPTTALTRLAKWQTGSVDFTVSSLRGAPVPVYLAGAEVVANHPLGPLAGTAFNLTAMSWGPRLDVGVHVDPQAVEDPALLVRELKRALTQLVRAGRTRRA